jgi:hypothetical protein
MKAFPTEHPIVGTMGLHADGMDLRDYFAAKAMESDIANWSVEAEKTREVGFWGYDEIAKRAYTMADAMMKARNDN